MKEASTMIEPLPMKVGLDLRSDCRFSRNIRGCMQKSPIISGRTVTETSELHNLNILFK
jgi:hypothetical protein